MPEGFKADGSPQTWGEWATEIYDPEEKTVPEVTEKTVQLGDADLIAIRVRSIELALSKANSPTTVEQVIKNATEIERYILRDWED